MPPKKRSSTPARRPAAPAPANNGANAARIPSRNYQRELHQFLAQYNFNGDLDTRFRQVYQKLLADKDDDGLNELDGIVKGLKKKVELTANGYVLVDQAAPEPDPEPFSIRNNLLAASGAAIGGKLFFDVGGAAWEYMRDNPDITLTSAGLGVAFSYGIHKFLQRRDNAKRLQRELQQAQQQAQAQAQAPPQAQVQAPPQAQAQQPPQAQAQAPPPQQAAKQPPPQAQAQQRRPRAVMLQDLDQLVAEMKDE